MNHDKRPHVTEMVKYDNGDQIPVKDGYDYELNLSDPEAMDSVIQSQYLTRAEYIELRKHLATMRGKALDHSIDLISLDEESRKLFAPEESEAEKG